MFLPLVILGLVCCVSGIPPRLPCYQHINIGNACYYGNLSVAVTGKMYRPKECNSYMDIKEIEHPPFIYINTTNATERFTMVMLDLGTTGGGPPYLQWMLTNVTVNSLPDYANSMTPVNTLVSYEKPLLMSGMPNPHLIQILIFRHYNVLRVPFGELWISQRQNFQLGKLYSNTQPNLQLCGPVAAIQFWVYDGRTPSAPPHPLPPYTVNPYKPGVPAVGQDPAAPPGNYPAFPPHYNPASSPNQPPTNFNRKPNSAALLQPFKLLLLPVIIKIVFL